MDGNTKPGYTEEQTIAFEKMVKDYKKMSNDALNEKKETFKIAMRQFRNKKRRLNKQIKNKNSIYYTRKDLMDGYIGDNLETFRANKRNVAAIWEAQRENGYEEGAKPARQTRKPAGQQSKMGADINLLSKMPSYLRPFNN
tara:strand:+ start:1127 stop:1549 length:423 start_codon:yes stop_codon:yes gene_type:complete